jgi:hypothetical protein
MNYDLTIADLEHDCFGNYKANVEECLDFCFCSIGCRKATYELPYTSIEELPEFLTSRYKDLRRLALQRLRELQDV